MWYMPRDKTSQPKRTLTSPWNSTSPLKKTGYRSVWSQRWPLLTNRWLHDQVSSCYPLTKTSSENVTEQTKRTLALLGKPDTKISDNGPQYVGQAYQNFVREWSIDHITSSPRYPQSNGFIEKTSPDCQECNHKMQEIRRRLQLALLSIRSTPISNFLPSPAEMLMKRKLASTLPHYSNAAPSTNVLLLNRDNRKCKRTMIKQLGDHCLGYNKVNLSLSETRTHKDGEKAQFRKFVLSQGHMRLPEMMELC